MSERTEDIESCVRPESLRKTQPVFFHNAPDLIRLFIDFHLHCLTDRRMAGETQRGVTMILRGIALTEISEDDIRQLVENHTRESQTLEFKRESYGRSDED